MMFAVSFLGTATASSLIVGSHLLQAASGFLTTIVGLLDLVFDLSGKAREHGYLRKRFMELYGECNLAVSTPAELRKWLDDLYQEEPPQFCAVTALAYNSAKQALNKGKDIDLLIVPLRCRILACYRRFDDVVFKLSSEVRAEKSKTNRTREGWKSWLFG